LVWGSRGECVWLFVCVGTMITDQGMQRDQAASRDIREGMGWVGCAVCQQVVLGNCGAQGRLGWVADATMLALIRVRCQKGDGCAVYKPA
jgi:hypothetical protein